MLDPAPGDEPEAVEVVRWPLADADALLARADFTEARSIAALFLVQRFLAGEESPPSPNRVDAGDELGSNTRPARIGPDADGIE